MPATRYTEFAVKELAGARYSATLKDETGAVVPAASLTALELTLWDVLTGTVVNSRDAQNVLNTNNVTVDGNGGLVWDIQPADNAIVRTTSTPFPERHRAMFYFTWSGGTKKGWHAVDLMVQDSAKLPVS